MTSPKPSPMLRPMLWLWLVLALLAGISPAQQERAGRRGVKSAAPAVTSIDPERRWAVVVGISSYQQLPEKDWLKFADADARAFYDFIVSPRGGGFRPDHVRLLVNREATTSAIREALVALTRKVQPGDVAYLFFAGHGIVEKQREKERAYLVTYDSDPQMYAATALRMAEVREDLEDLSHAGHLVVVTDACHAGHLGDAVARGEDTPTSTINRHWDEVAASSRSVLKLMASRADQLSYEFGELGHGAFTYCLLQALNGAGKTGTDPFVRARDVIAYLEVEVPKLTRDRQTPRHSLDYDDNLPLAILAAPLTAAAAQESILHVVGIPLNAEVYLKQAKTLRFLGRAVAEGVELIAPPVPPGDYEILLILPDQSRRSLPLALPGGPRQLDVTSGKLSVAGRAIAQLPVVTDAAEPAPVALTDLVVRAPASSSIYLDGQFRGRILDGADELLLSVPLDQLVKVRIAAPDGERTASVRPTDAWRTVSYHPGRREQLEEAIAADRLLDAGWALYEAAPELRDRLFVALADRGQQYLLDYLNDRDPSVTSQDPRKISEHWGRAADVFERAHQLQPSNALRARQLFAEGMQVHYSYIYDESKARLATDKLRQSLELDPEAAYAHMALALALFDQYQDEQALAEAERARALAPQWAGAFSRKGRLLSVVERIPEAEACYRRALELAPRNLTFQCSLMNLLLSRDRVEEARALLQAALARNPGHPQLRLVEARLARVTWQLAQGEQTVRDVTASTPAYATELLRNLLEQERYPDAERVAREYAAAFPDDTDTPYVLSKVYAGMGRPDQAEALVREALAKNPGEVYLYQRLGDLLESEGRLNEALQAYQQAQRLAPSRRFMVSWQVSALIDLGRLPEALKLAQEAVAERPDHAFHRVSLGHVWLAMGREAEAEVAYREALKLNPKLPLAYLKLMRMQSLQGRHDEAIATGRSALAQLPYALEVRRGLAETLSAAGRLEEGCRVYEEAIAAFPQAPSLPRDYGSFLKKKDPKRAAAICRQAVQARPQDKNAWDALGYVLQGEGLFAESLEAFGKAAALAPGEALHVAEQGYSLYKLQRLPEAREALERALRINPNSGDAWGYLSVVCRAQHDMDAAMEALHKAIGLRPQVADYWFVLGAYQLRELKQPREAAASMRRGLLMRPRSSVEVYAGYEDCNPGPEAEDILRRGLREYAGSALMAGRWGHWLLAQGRVPEAMAVFQDVVKRFPTGEDAGLAAGALGRWQLEQGQALEAVASFAHAEKLDPTFAGYATGLGEALYNLHRDDEAEQALGRALKLNAAYPDAHYWLGVVYCRHDLAKALPCLTRAVELDPERARNQYHLAELLLHLKKYAEAEVRFLAAARLMSKDPRPHQRLAEVYTQLNRPDDAARERALAESLAPRPAPSP